MKRTKIVVYNSCDLCDSIEEAKGQCDICGKYLCAKHCQNYPWGDQEYQFCSEHYAIVQDIIKKTGIPIGFVVPKLKGEGLGYMKDLWNERGYEDLWRKR